MIERKAAIATVVSFSRKTGKERVPLRESVGRTLAENIASKIPVPPFDSSAMDGFAVRSADVSNASHKNPSRLRVIGESRAGRPFLGSLGKGQAAKISTGAMIPKGADCVVMKEVCRESGNEVSVFVRQRKRENIFPEGEDMKKRSVVARKGVLIRPQEAGVIASCGISSVAVARKPTATIIFTGDEITEPGKPLRKGKIYNSNLHIVCGLLEGMGCNIKKIAHCGDSEKFITDVMKNSKTDVIVASGGVSVGEHDHVKDAFRAAGGREIFWKVQMKPGKPFFFGKLGRSLFFGLPGNPAACYVCLEQFVRPSIMKMLGRMWQRKVERATLSSGIRKGRGREHLIRGFVEDCIVTPMKSQSSGVLSSFLRSNAIIVAPKSSSIIRRGEKVDVEMLEG